MNTSHDQRYKHGHAPYHKHSKEYNTFKCMQRRCCNPKMRDYPCYGGRGIECRYADFPAFLDDVGLAPTPHHQIDRIDNNGHYEKGNCRWVTPKDNCRNRRSSKYITYQGETKTMVEWAEVTGVPYKTLHYRITVKGWDVERAFCQPVKGVRLVEYKGEQLTLAEIARRSGLHLNTLVYRYKQGVRGEALTAETETAQHDERTGQFVKQHKPTM